MKRIKTVIVIFIMFFSINIFAYVFPHSEISADKTEIEIGETVRVKCEITLPLFAKLIDKEEAVTVENWDIKNIVFKKDYREKNKYIVYIDLVTFNSDIKNIAPIRFTYINRDTEDTDISDGQFYFFSNSLPVVIKDIFEGDSFENIRDIKSPKKFKLSKYIFLLLVLFVLFVILFVYKDLLLKKIGKKLEKISLSAEEEAIRNINKILMSDNFSGLPAKECYCKLSSILKKFILKKSGISKKEITTSEIVALVSNENNCFFEKSKEIIMLFRNYDSVKFAGFKVNRKAVEDILLSTKEFIERY